MTTSDESTTASPVSAPLSADELHKINAYWRACNYLAAGMIYLRDNPLLKEPLKPEHIKNRLLGHWGSSPGLSFAYIHMNRLINKYGLDAIFLAGPGHGAPGVLAPVYLEGTYAEIYPNKGEDEEGMLQFFKEFSFPGGIGSHCTPETPGSIHEGGELGYSISHAYGAAFDNPDLLVTVVVGDGESETGPLATSWHSNKFLNPIRDGAVLPILASERLQDQQSDDLVAHFPRGTGTPVSGLRLYPLLRGRQRPRDDAPTDGRRSRNLCAGNSPDSGGSPPHRYPNAATLADDRITQPERLDGAQGSGWPQSGRLLAFTPGASCRHERKSCASETTGRLAAQL